MYCVMYLCCRHKKSKFFQLPKTNFYPVRDDIAPTEDILDCRNWRIGGWYVKRWKYQVSLFSLQQPKQAISGEKMVPNDRRCVRSEHSWRRTEWKAGRATRRTRKCSKKWPPQRTNRQQLAARFPGESSEGPVTQMVHSNRESEMVAGAHWPWSSGRCAMLWLTRETTNGQREEANTRRSC